MLSIVIHEELGIETLYELEAAAKDGRLAQVQGMGEGLWEAIHQEVEVWAPIDAQNALDLASQP